MVMRIKISKELFEEWNQKTVATISPISIILYASINRICLKYDRPRERLRKGCFIGSTKENG